MSFQLDRRALNVLPRTHGLWRQTV